MQTGYILGMLIATFSPRRSRMFCVNVLQQYTQHNTSLHTVTQTSHFNCTNQLIKHAKTRCCQ